MLAASQPVALNALPQKGGGPKRRSSQSTQHSSSRSGSHLDSARLGELSSPTSYEDTKHELIEPISKTHPEHLQSTMSAEMADPGPVNLNLDANSIVHTESYIHDIDDDSVVLNKRVSRASHQSRRRDTQESLVSNLPFQASKHAQIMPREKPTRMKSHVSLQPRTTSTKNDLLDTSNPQPPVLRTSKTSPSSTPLLSHANSTLYNIPHHGTGLKRSESATNEIKKMRENLLQKREMKRKRKSFLIDDDRVLIGNKVTEGHVNFIIAYNMLTGIRVAVSRCSGIMKPLTSRDFKCSKKLAFDYHGNELTPSSQYAFKFKDYSPEVFRELRALFGLDPADYLVSLTSKYILSELNSPGKSGSFFYYSRDYKYIIKTIHHNEHLHLRRHLQEYYSHIKSNPDTLVCQFYGLHRVKMPISFRHKMKHRKIYFLVMNNLFPPHLPMHTTYDLKGSKWGRLTNVDKKRYEEDQNYNPVLKDLNWIENDCRIAFGPIKKKKFLTQLKRDVELLAKLNIMDYSLLLGIHDMTRHENSSENPSIDAADEPRSATPQAAEFISYNPLKHGSVIPHYFKEYEGGIRASDTYNEDLPIIYYVGIIDCLTNYSIIKRMETFWRTLRHDPTQVSAIPPADYAGRFYKFIHDSVGPRPVKRYKDKPDHMA